MRLLVYRDSLFAILHVLDPTGITLRRQKMQAKKGEYIMLSLNWIWSIDSYDKLSPFSIEIYAYINAYSRNIIWIYVGISNCTSYLIL